MMHPEQVKALLKQSFPDAEIDVCDQTGTQDHFEIRVVSRQFAGKTLVDQHRLVQAAVQGALADGTIHAVQIKTQVPK